MDISNLSERELRDLNHKIVERLRFLQQTRTHKAMMEFAIGSAVSFEADGETVRGIISRFNKKTVTIVTQEGVRWNVSPSFLSKANVSRDVTPREKAVVKTLRIIQGTRTDMNVSRNAPCPCGSGKKFKRCCAEKTGATS